MTFFGIFLLILAVIFFFVSRSQTGKRDALNAAESYEANLLSAVHEKIVTGVGSDAFRQNVSLSGTIECEAPIIAPGSQTECVAYSRSVNREYEERVTTTNSEGKKETRMERRSENLESISRRVPFFVRDQTGRILIDPDEATIEDMEQVLDSFEDAPGAKSVGGARRELGKRISETVLRVSERITVVGLAQSRDNAVVVSADPNDKVPFIISKRSLIEQANAAASWAKNMTYAAAGCGAVGAIFVVIGLING